MPTEKLGEIITILGMALLILSTMGRRQGRKVQEAAWVKWGDYAAFGLLLTGILLLWASK